MPASTPPCGLYLRIALASDFERTVQSLRQAAFVINRSPYEQNMHMVEIEAGDEASRDRVAALIALVQAEGLVAIVKGSVDLAKDLEADGVLVASADDIDDARAQMGDARIVGAVCDLGRTEAEIILQHEADYILFETPGRVSLPSADLLAWWASSTDAPSVAGGAVTNDTAGPLVRAGATFLDCTDYVWTYEKGVMQAVTNMLYAIDLAMGGKQAMN